MNHWTFYWLIIWFGLGFGIAETWALVTGHPENTLSWTVWRLFSSTGSVDPLEWPFKRYLLLVGMIWLTVHFCWAIWR